MAKGDIQVKTDALADWFNAERELVWSPAIELRQKDGLFELTAAVAGLDAKDVEVHATAEDILIKGKTAHTRPGRSTSRRRDVEPAQLGHMPFAIATEHLDRRFGDIHAVADLTLTVDEGAMFGLLGANGAGKTTLIKMLTTLLPPTGGRALVAGYDVVRDAAHVRRAIGYVPQMLSADGTLTGYENLLVFAQLYDIPRHVRAGRIAEALELMGLAAAGGRMVREYSGGMIRRLEIAQSMLHRPAVLFLDEPTIGLDPIARATVWDHVKTLRAEFGTTILMTTHLMEEADEFCEQVAVMHRGRVSIVGAPADLKAAIGPAATMDDVFVRYAGLEGDASERLRDVSRDRQTARRLG